MKSFKTLVPVIAASAIAVSGLTATSAAQADMSASFAASNMYLWRGQNVGPSGGAISGSLDYSNPNGFYAGVWTSSEFEGHETDLYLGYSMETSGVGIDLSYWNYLYPEDGGTGPGTGLSDTDAAEFVLGLSYMDFSFGAYINADSDNADNNYFTLGYATGPYSATYGFWQNENETTGDEYSHITVGYAATDELSFAVSIASSDDGSTEEDPLFQVTYAKSFDLNKK
jgi:uncharacterized protein (TIGR02001 family)